MHEPGADLEEWKLDWHEDVEAGEPARVAAPKASRSGVLEMEESGLRCCPEDVQSTEAPALAATDTAAAAGPC